MRNDNCSFKVTKNKLTRLALKDTKYQHMDDMFRGPTAIGSSKDPVMAAKVLVNFANENEKLVIIGGGLEDKSLSKDDVVALAKLPSLNDLRGKLVGLLQAPALKIARLTKEPASKVLRTISQKSQQQ
jgi:large subunit ribosomal protein L10